MCDALDVDSRGVGEHHIEKKECNLLIKLWQRFGCTGKNSI